jgi:prepilin peptidase CpaA
VFRHRRQSTTFDSLELERAFETSMTISLVLGLAAAIATAAALMDLHTRRIPNWLTASTVCLGVAVNVWLAGIAGGVSALGGAALGLAILLPFYVLRAMGAGDVKLLAALGALVGPMALVSVAAYGALVGGVIAAVMLARRGRLAFALNEMIVQQQLPSKSGQTAPYGVAIASGVYLAMLLPRVLG